MSPRLHPIAVVLAFGVAVLHSEEAAPAKAAPVARGAAETAVAKPDALPPYQLKNQSKFSVATPQARAPFWPIGWVKRQTGTTVQSAAPAAPQVQLDEKSFKVTSILIGSGTTPSLAVINGRAYSEGEFLRMPKGGVIPPLRVRVQRINDGTVILQNAEQTLVASLVHPELSNRKPEDLLLDADR